jgi:hypothetical protein
MNHSAYIREVRYPPGEKTRDALEAPYMIGGRSKAIFM